MPQPYYSPGKSPRYPLNRRLGVHQSRSGQYQEVKIIGPTGTRTPTPLSNGKYVLKKNNYDPMNYSDIK
jgi:hypothetical protein